MKYGQGLPPAGGWKLFMAAPLPRCKCPICIVARARRKASNSQPGERVEPREGVLTVYDHEGRYVGCIGAETWQDLIAREATISQEPQR